MPRGQASPRQRLLSIQTAFRRIETWRGTGRGGVGSAPGGTCGALPSFVSVTGALMMPRTASSPSFSWRASRTRSRLPAESPAMLPRAQMQLSSRSALASGTASSSTKRGSAPAPRTCSVCSEVPGRGRWRHSNAYSRHTLHEESRVGLSGVRMALPPAVAGEEGKIHRVDPDFGSTSTASDRDSQSNCCRVNWKKYGSTLWISG